MNIMKKIFSTLFVVLFATSMMAQSGLTCEDPIPVDKSYVGRVEAGSELWYTAFTYDLPLHVYFSPDIDDSKTSPLVTIDFTCEPDVYDDHKLDSVINILKVLGLSLPVEFWCDKVVRDGKVEWDLSVDERYRNQLTEYGLTHNVQAFVNVYFPDAGEIRLTPDTLYQYCINNGHYTVLGDTMQVAANDTETMFVLPYSEWQKDSIRFVWTGDKPARIWVAEEDCQFTPTDASVYIKAKYDIAKDTPHKLYPADMKSAIDNWIGSGVFFAKVISEGEGQLVVERIPLGEIQGGATLLKHGETVALEANDDRVFCFPKGWNSTEFLANTQYLMAMHVSSTPDFQPGDANVISKYAFAKDGSKRQLQLTKGDISALGESATSDYLYVRFVSNKATALTPSLWNVSSCVAKTVLIQSGETFVNNSDKVYRMAYADWAGYGFNVAWDQRGALSAHVSSFCDVKTTDTQKIQIISVPARSSVDVTESDLAKWETSVDAEGFVYMCLQAGRQGNVTFTSAKPVETDPETPVIPEPEYVYESYAVCFGETYEWNGQELTKTDVYTHTETDDNGAVTITELTFTVHPQTPDTTEEVTIAFGETYEWNGQTYSTEGEYTITLPDENGCDYQATLQLTVLQEEKPVDPCVENSELLEPTANLTLSLKDVFDVYRIDCEAWMASGVNLVWKGTAPLHTFVAMDCVFAVAKAHIDVVNYTEVPADGQVILSKEILSDLAQHSREGFLYVRFATEFEGELTIVPAE